MAIRFREHAYIKWHPHIQPFLATAKLNKLHRRFFHPSANKLCNFLRLPGLYDTPWNTRTTLLQINLRDPCRRYVQTHRRFNLKIKDIFEFNHFIYAYVFYIDKKPTLHGLDEATDYQKATRLPFLTENDHGMPLGIVGFTFTSEHLKSSDMMTEQLYCQSFPSTGSTTTYSTI